jgi:hypothetical protein
LLEALAAPGVPPTLRSLENWFCRATRRAMRLLRIAGLALAQRLGLLTALTTAPWMLPNPDLSETLFRLADQVLSGLPRLPPSPGLLTRIGRVLAIADGRAVWSKRFAPP